MRDSKGRFIKGNDPDRHKFTRDECITGFWNAIESIVLRHPEKIDENNNHIVIRFLKRRRKKI